MVRLCRGWIRLSSQQPTREEEFADFDEARTGGGGYGAAKLGYRIDDAWDVAAGFRYLKQSSGRINDDTYDWQFTGGRYWNADVEAGYRLQQDDWSLRPFAGLRYQHYGADFRDHIGTTYSATETSWGIGPRVGIDVSKPLGAQLSFFGSGDASVLFGKIKAERDYSGLEEFSESRTFATVGLKTGLAWEFAPGVNLGQIISSNICPASATRPSLKPPIVFQRVKPASSSMDILHVFHSITDWTALARDFEESDFGEVMRKGQSTTAFQSGAVAA